MASSEQLLRMSLAEEATCPICLGYFTQPVFVQCGHSFCTPCITRYWEGAQGGAYPCPQCRETSPANTLRPNRHLASMVQILTQGPPVAPPRDGHGMCTEHDEKLKLFCQQDQTPICVICRESREHQDHKVRPVREAAQEYQDKFQSYLDDVKRELENVLGLQQKEEAKLTDLEEKFKVEREQITRVFSQVQQFLEKEKCRLFNNLDEEEKKIQQRIRDKITKLDDQQTMVRDQITEMETKCQLPDVELLKDVKSILSRFEKMKCQYPDSGNFKEKEKETSKDEEEEERDPMLKIIESLEWSCASSYSREVTLDPNTAHVRLILSEDGRSVRDGVTAQKLPDTPERFNPVINVLGRERLSSGRHYWEVEVGDKTQWGLGVCAESVSRKGTITASPEDGYWAVWLEGGEYEALTSDSTPLTPSEPPRVVGLFLDYEAGRFSVYNVTGRSLLFTFSGAPFPHTLRPFFCPGLSDGGKNGGALQVLPATGQE